LMAMNEFTLEMFTMTPPLPLANVNCAFQIYVKYFVKYLFVGINEWNSGWTNRSAVDSIIQVPNSFNNFPYSIPVS